MPRLCPEGALGTGQMLVFYGVLSYVARLCMSEQMGILWNSQYTSHLKKPMHNSWQSVGIGQTVGTPKYMQASHSPWRLAPKDFPKIAKGDMPCQDSQTIAIHSYTCGSQSKLRKNSGQPTSSLQESLSISYTSMRVDSEKSLSRHRVSSKKMMILTMVSFHQKHGKALE